MITKVIGPLLLSLNLPLELEEAVDPETSGSSPTALENFKSIPLGCEDNNPNLGFANIAVGVFRDDLNHILLGERLPLVRIGVGFAQRGDSPHQSDCEGPLDPFSGAVGHSGFSR